VGPAFGFNGPSGISITGLSTGSSCCGNSDSGYGNFQYVIKGPTPAGNAPATLTFTLGLDDGFNNVAQLGTLFMAHVIPPNGAPTGDATTTVPGGDPSTVVLLTRFLPMAQRFVAERHSGGCNRTPVPRSRSSYELSSPLRADSASFCRSQRPMWRVATVVFLFMAKTTDHARSING